MSVLAARYPVNSNGSATEDINHMENGTGLRNCTVRGLRNIRFCNPWN